MSIPIPPPVGGNVPGGPTSSASATGPNGTRLHPRLGYAIGHVLTDIGPIEWLEDVDGHTVVHEYDTDALAARARIGADPEVWDLIELRIVRSGGGV